MPPFFVSRSLIARGLCELSPRLLNSLSFKSLARYADAFYHFQFNLPETPTCFDDGNYGFVSNRRAAGCCYGVVVSVRAIP